MKKRWKALYIVPTMLLILGLAACGKDKNAAGSALEQKEYLWDPKFLELPADAGIYSGVQIRGDILYYMENKWDEANNRNKYIVKGMSLTDSSEKVSAELAMETVSGEGDGGNSSRNLRRFCLDSEGNFLTLEMVYHWDENGGGRDSTECFLCRYDQTGKKTGECDFTKEAGENSDADIQSMAVDAQDRVCAAAYNTIFLFDAPDSFCGRIDAGADTYITSVGTDREGVMCAVLIDYNAGDRGTNLKEIDFDKKAFGNSYANYPNSYHDYLVPGVEKSTLCSDGNKVYEYDKAGEKSEELLTWVDSNINGDSVNYFGVLEDGRILVITRGDDDNGPEIALLEKKKASELPKKTVITIGSMYQNQTLQSAAVKFNKKSDEYRITFRVYYDMNSVTSENYQEAAADAIKRFNSDITSRNCPDLLDLSSLNTERLAAKGVFEDLGAYLDKSAVLSRDDYIESILNAYTYDGVLVAVPRSFQLETVAGKTSEVGAEPGWTLEEMLAYADKHPDAAIFDYSSKANILQFLLAYNQGAFVDWKAGKCSFDTDTFKNLLRFVDRFPEEYDWQSDDNRSTATKIADGDVLLDRAYIFNFDSIQQTEGMFNEPVTYIGYPNDEGSGGCYLQADGLLAMAAKSKNKDGSWQFLESFLTAENTWYDFGIPARKSAFQAAKEEATKVEYGEDENGNQIVIGGGSMSYGDGWTYEYHTTTEEEVERLMRLIEIARPITDSDNQIMEMIREEAEPFFKGDKSADDVASIVQSRVQLYVNENR